MDSERLFEKAAAFLGADLKRMKNSRKVPADLVLDRDLMLYLLWQQGHQTNQQIGELFGLTHSAASRRISIFKNLLHRDKRVGERLEQIKSKIEI
jgi:chromosomal replication initiation ATPase DnaA